MKRAMFFQKEEKGAVLLPLGPTGEGVSGLAEVNANTKEAAVEKHIPAVSAEGKRLTVRVGSVAHPMTPEHYIEWVLVETKTGGLYRNLTPQDAPEAVFEVDPDSVLAVYAYCNLHGLWKAEGDN